MPVSYEFDSERRIVIVTVQGEFRDEDLLEIYERLRAEPRLEPDFGLLVDLHQATGRDITMGGVQDLVARPLLLSLESRRAIVVDTDLGFGMSRMYELLRGDMAQTIRVFRDFNQAELWLERGEG